MKKVVLALTLYLSLGIGENVYVAPNVEIYGMQWAEACEGCGSVLTGRVTKSYGMWMDVEGQECSKYANKLDLIQKRLIARTFQCSNCKYTYKTTGVQRRVYCDHKSAE